MDDRLATIDMGRKVAAAVLLSVGELRPNQGRSKKFILGGYNFLLHDTTVLYTSSLTTSAAISAQNNFQGLILGGYIYRYIPRRYAPGPNLTQCRHGPKPTSISSGILIHPAVWPQYTNVTDRTDRTTV